MPEPTPNQAAAEKFAAAGPAEPGLSAGEVDSPGPPAEDVPASAEEAQAAASAALDELTLGAPEVHAAAGAPPGEDDESAAEALPPASEEPDYKDRYLRASADMDNLRKRARRDAGLAEARGVGKLAKELLPAIDNLERALQAAEAVGESSADLVQGLRLVQAELVGALGRAGIAIEDPKGQPFDPHRHEALAQAPAEGVEAGVVTEVYQPGYVLGDTVLRAARVVVSG